ncbi:hypothetical protein WN55_04814 [Dufourea novaeangliae]|uniref:Uncharacterized protein n=1 Tax=Dufourea novaeangliae TaxID=178035 RepID=A0A154P0W8_DUFNO|nr:hypothetical protein WN55_04814 [Dufourea novaeangliae]
MLSASDFDFDSSNSANPQYDHTDSWSCWSSTTEQLEGFRWVDCRRKEEAICRRGPTQIASLKRATTNGSASSDGESFCYYFVTVLACSCSRSSLFCGRLLTISRTLAKSWFELVLRMRRDHGLHGIVNFQYRSS